GARRPYEWREVPRVSIPDGGCSPGLLYTWWFTPTSIQRVRAEVLPPSDVEEPEQGDRRAHRAHDRSGGHRGHEDPGELAAAYVDPLEEGEAVPQTVDEHRLHCPDRHEGERTAHQ